MAKVGAPKKYRKEHCKAVIDYMQKGMSITAFAGHIGVSKQTVYNWQSKHKEFFDACTAAQALSQQWWEKLAMMVATGVNQNNDSDGTPNKYKKANQGMIMFMMSRRFEDYYKKSHTSITKTDETPGNKDIPEKTIPVPAMDREKAMELLKSYLSENTMTDDEFREKERKKLKNG